MAAPDFEVYSEIDSLKASSAESVAVFWLGEVAEGTVCEIGWRSRKSADAVCAFLVGPPNPPIGIILCAPKGQTLVKYAPEGLPNKVIAAEYRTALPSEEERSKKLEETRHRLELKLPTLSADHTAATRKEKT